MYTWDGTYVHIRTHGMPFSTDISCTGRSSSCDSSFFAATGPAGLTLCGKTDGMLHSLPVKKELHTLNYYSQGLSIYVYTVWCSGVDGIHFRQ